LTPAGKLAVRSGPFRAYIETFPDEFPETAPEGDCVDVPPGIVEAVRGLYPFTSDDATRPWAAGVLFHGQSAFATNNIALVEAWLGARMPVTVNVPRYALREVLRIGQEPIRLQVSEQSLTFHYEGDRWLRTQLNSTAWPDTSPIFEATQ